MPENEALGQAGLAWRQVGEGLDRLSGPVTLWAAYAGAAMICWTAARSRARAPLVLVLALAAAAALPWYAFYAGHPFRVSYSVPLIVASAAIAGVAVSLLPRWSRSPRPPPSSRRRPCRPSPLDRGAPLIAESQRDAANQAGRRAVTAYLVAHHDGTPIMMSMGSLAHYMHDLVGERLRDSRLPPRRQRRRLEGGGEDGPRPYVSWVAIEEAAEGGDALFARARADARFLEGFVRVAEGGRRSPVSG